VGRNQAIAELLLGQTCPLATSPQWEEAVALPRPCELQPGLSENMESGLEVALALQELLALRGCTATAGEGKGTSAGAVSCGQLRPLNSHDGHSPTVTREMKSVNHKHKPCC